MYILEGLAIEIEAINATHAKGLISQEDHAFRLEAVQVQIKVEKAKQAVASCDYRRQLIRALEGDNQGQAKQAARDLHKLALYALKPLAALSYRPDLFQGPTGTVKLFKSAFKALVKVTI